MPPYISCEQLRVDWTATTHTVLLTCLQSEDFTSDLATTKPSAHDPGAKHRGQRGHLEAQISEFRTSQTSSGHTLTTVYPIELIFEPPLLFRITNNPMIS